MGVLAFALTIPVSAWLADRFGRHAVLVFGNMLVVAFGAAFASLFRAGSPGYVVALLAMGLGLMGVVYGPLGTVLAELFPTRVRYTGASLAFNLAGIFGASLAPYAATWLSARHGLGAVGLYIAAAGMTSLVAIAIARRLRLEAES